MTEHWDDLDELLAELLEEPGFRYAFERCIIRRGWRVTERFSMRALINA